jgi:hypothetical protein
VADSESAQGKSKTTSRSAAAKPEAQSGNGNGDTLPPIPVNQLVADGSALLGHPSHAVAGALAGHDPDEMLDIDEAKAAVEAWLQTPVAVDPGAEGEVE